MNCVLKTPKIYIILLFIYKENPVTYKSENSKGNNKKDQISDISGCEQIKCNHSIWKKTITFDDIFAIV